MPFKKTQVLVGLFMAAMGTIIIVQGLYIGLPALGGYLIRQKLPAFPRGFEPQFSIESVGMHRTRLRDLSLGQGIRADSLELSYSWHGDQSFQVTGLRIIGLIVRASVGPDFATRINGFLLNPPSEPSPGGEAHNDPGFQGFLSDFLLTVPETMVPFIPEKVRLDHSRLLVDLTGRQFEFPFDAGAEMVGNTGTIKTRMTVSVSGQKIELSAQAHMNSQINKGIDNFRIETRGRATFSLAQELVFPHAPVRLTGTGKIHGFLNPEKRFQFHLSNFRLAGRDIPDIQLDTVHGNLDIHTLELNLTAGIRLLHLAKTPVPFELSLAAALGDVRLFELSGISRPVETLVLDQFLKQRSIQISTGIDALAFERPRLSFKFAGDPKEVTAQMGLSAANATIRSGTGTFSGSKINISAQSRGHLQTDSLAGKIDWTLSADQFTATPRLGSRRPDIVSGPVQSHGSLYIDPDKQENRSNFTVNIQGVTAKEGAGRLGIGKIDLSGDTQSKSDSLLVNMKARLVPADLVMGDLQLSVPRCGWSGQIRRNGNTPLSFDLNPWVEQASVILAKEKVSARGITFKTRITRPFIKAGPGQLEVRDILFQDRLRAAFFGELNQTDTQRIRLAGQLRPEAFIQTPLELVATAGLAPEPWANAHITGRHLEITRSTIKKVYPPFDLSGQIRLDATAEAWASFDLGNFSSHGVVEIHDGLLDFPDMKLTAGGIKGRLNLRDLGNMESYPGQMLTMDLISMGQFRFEKAALRFRVEDSQTLGIENLKFNWCQGLVSSEAAQIPAPDGRIQLILFCDRLQMDMLLNQMGAFDAHGGGTLSGRIPLTYQNDGFSFENGFLFSTPGKGGRVYVRDLDRIMAGFPKGTPESTYLEMAGEALKDFEYNWATLRMNSHGDTLNVNMELDGKPARILPFEFRKDINAFVRVDSSSPGAHFQGIKLDLNLKLPFNQVTKFGRKIKSFME